MASMNMPAAGTGSPLAAADSAASWLRDAAWPLWLEHGVDWARGGFCESLDLETLQSPAQFRRLRVVARQVFVFAHAHAAGLPRAAEAVELGVAFLRQRARAADGGYAQRFALDGAVISDHRDLYDHAFVLLALSSASRLLPAAPLRREALALLRYLDSQFPHPQGGYLESLPPALPRRQNPHMHLLEACLAAAEAFGDDIFLQRAGDIVRLFLDRFFDQAHGTLPEFFSEALEPQRENGIYLVEPGHHCEWVWLLEWYRQLSAGHGTADAAAIVAANRGLMGFVDRFGINPQLGTLYDEVAVSGEVHGHGSRLWPQTERLKAEILRPDASADKILAAFTALGRYLTPAPLGLWHERLDQSGHAPAEPAPASSLYHLTAGIVVSQQHLAKGTVPA
jgi:mannose/cellobiose epimerase-like protein (N-acyl-D-glucosamine 2-epimerase family)